MIEMNFYYDDPHGVFIDEPESVTSEIKAQIYAHLVGWA